MIKEKNEPLVTTICVVMAMLLAVLSLFIGHPDVVTASEPTYMTSLFSKNSVISIDIAMDESDWEAMIENATAEEYVACDITIDGTVIKNAAIRPKGNSSLTQVANDDTTDRFSFKISFDEYVTGQTYDGLSSLALNNTISDATYMKEYLSYEMMESMGIATPGYSYAMITKNGEAWGLYLAVEILDTDFLERNYGTDYGNLYKPESDDMDGGGNMGNMNNIQPPAKVDGEASTTVEVPNGNTVGNAPPDMAEGGQPPTPPDMNTTADTAKTDTATDTTTQSARSTRQGGMGSRSSSTGTSLVYTDDNIDSYPGIFDGTVTKSTTTADQQKIITMMKTLASGENLESVLDVKEVLRYFAVNTFLVNLDSYAGSLKHNYYLYEKDGIVQILPWDFNLSFGAFQSGNASQVINFPIDAPVTDTMENSPLISKLLENDEYKAQYHEYLEVLITIWFTNGYFNSEIQRLDLLINDLVEADPTAFYTIDEYTAAISELKVYGEERTASILAQLSGKQPSDSYGTMETTLNLQALGSNGGGGGGAKMGGGGFKAGTDTETDISQDAQRQTPPDFSKSRGNMQASSPNISYSLSISDILSILFFSLLLAGGIAFAFIYKRRKYNIR